MKSEQIKSLRGHIKQAEDIRDKANYQIEKDMARYLIKRLKNNLLKLMYPQPKGL